MIRFLLWLGCGAAVLLGGLVARVAAQRVTDPMPLPILNRGLRVEIRDLAQMPDTSDTLGAKRDHQEGRRTRINLAREAPDGRLFVNDLRGQLYVLGEDYQPQLYLDIDAANGGEGSIFPAAHFAQGLSAGFINFTFHPEFATNGLFYTNHTERAAATAAVPHFATTDMADPDRPVTWHTVITEWTTPDPTRSAWDEASGSRRELLRVGTTATSYFHPFGDLQFNPTALVGDNDYGLLYISGGDWAYINGALTPTGSITNGQPGQLQRLDTLAGTMLRIDPRSPAESGGQAGIGDYTIPPENPFVDGDASTLDEIYAFGLRNGHRMAWDPDGTLFVTSIGEASLEEIERIEPGGNYGWAEREGTFVSGLDLDHGGDGVSNHVFEHTVSDLEDVDFRGEEFLYPVVQYDHDEGRAIAGGFVYQGDDIPQLVGKFVFGDIPTGRIFAADVSEMKQIDITEPGTTASIEEIQLFVTDSQGVETNVRLHALAGGGRTDLRFGQGSDGEIYVTSKGDGMLRRLVGPGPLLSADFDGDGEVDGTDYLIWQFSFGVDAAGDADDDGDSDGDDFLLWQAQFGRGPLPSHAVHTAVPEPSAVLLCCCGLTWAGWFPSLRLSLPGMNRLSRRARSRQPARRGRR